MTRMSASSGLIRRAGTSTLAMSFHAVSAYRPRPTRMNSLSRFERMSTDSRAPTVFPGVSPLGTSSPLCSSAFTLARADNGLPDSSSILLILPSRYDATHLLHHFQNRNMVVVPHRYPSL